MICKVTEKTASCNGYQISSYDFLNSRDAQILLIQNIQTHTTTFYYREYTKHTLQNFLIAKKNSNKYKPVIDIY